MSGVEAMNTEVSTLTKSLILHGLVGLGYYATCSRYQLLSKEVLQSQGTLFALSSIAHTFLQPHTKEELNSSDMLPLVLITLAKAWTEVSWKTQALCTAVLGGSTLLINKSLNWHPEIPRNPHPERPRHPNPQVPKDPNPKGLMEPLDCSTQIGTTTICIQTGDLLQSPVEAIVNAANTTLLGGGGIDGIIHRAAGPNLLKECEAIPEIRPGHRINTGEAKVTGSHNIQKCNSQVHSIVHTAGPKGGTPNRQKLLADAYQNCLIEAAKSSIRSIAFPAISVGIFGYPVQEAQDIAFATVREYVEQNPKKFDLIIFAYLQSNPTHLVAAKNAWESKIAPLSQ